MQRTGIGRQVFRHPDLHREQTVYRYVTIDTAVATFANSALRLRRPDLWDDPYERWWTRQLFVKGSKLEHAKAFGICWTTRARDEPVWRLYTCPQMPTVPAVRLRSKVGALEDLLLAKIATETGKGFIGRVRYAAGSTLRGMAKGLRDPAGEVARVAAEALHWKRTQFILEREVRVLWVVTSKEEDQYHDVSFEPDKLIDQVMIGPTVDAAQAEQARERLIAAGVPKRLLRKSKLYSPVTDGEAAEEGRR